MQRGAGRSRNLWKGPSCGVCFPRSGDASDAACGALRCGGGRTRLARRDPGLRQLSLLVLTRLWVSIIMKFKSDQLAPWHLAVCIFFFFHFFNVFFS